MQISEKASSHDDAGRDRGGDLRLAVDGDDGDRLRESAEPASYVPVEDLAAAARAAGDRPGRFLISGTNPLQHPDFAEIVKRLAAIRSGGLGLRWHGEGLDQAMAQDLRRLGIQWLRIPFHSARQDAHDWLVGRPGALKAAHRALRACLAAGLPVSAEIAATRPTAPLLAETVEVLSRSGIGAIEIRRLRRCDTSDAEFVPLSPRLSLLEGALEQAAATALRRRARLTLRDFPLCAAPRLAKLMAPADSETWITPGSAPATALAGCADCPGPPQCGGAPLDYVERFGWEELRDPRVAAIRLAEDVAGQQAAATSAPQVLSWRGPQRMRCAACAGSTLSTTADSTRVVRARLVEAAAHRPQRLRLVGSSLLAHPQAAALIFDALRLFAAVEVAGEASPVVDWTDLEVRRLRELSRFDVAFYGAEASTHDAHCGIPGAFAAAVTAIERLRGAGIEVGAYAILHDGSAVADFAAAWQRGELPGTPRFRLSPQGTSIDELIQVMSTLPGPARAALAAQLPACAVSAQEAKTGDHRPSGDLATVQRTIDNGRTIPYEACGTDPIGTFTPCNEDAETCVRLGCPGTAVGWQPASRSNQWSKSS